MDAPTTDLDVYADETLADPYPVYEALRALGSAVWMTAHDAFVLSHFDACRDALRNWKVFSSALGVMMNDPVNEALGGNILLCTDGDEHARQRSVIAAPMTPRALAEVREHISAEADVLADRLMEQGTFDAAGELAHHLPVTIVGSLVGLPDAGRERMVEWAGAAFDTIGPMNGRTLAALPLIEEMNGYIATECTPDKLRPGSWSMGLFEAAERGQLGAEEAALQINNYLAPALDTTIHSTSAMIWLFAQHPEQWAKLRANPDLVTGAINEVLRMETVIQGFARHTTEDRDVDGTTIPSGARVLVLYASANRDERQFADPTSFDVERPNAGDHLALGHGSHACPGGHLAKLEMRAIIEALLPRVQRFELIDATWAKNNTLRGLATCTVSVVPA